MARKIGVLGAGTWGIALARMLSVSGSDVLVWSAIPREIDESAMLDGCGCVRMFVSVIFPLLKPITVTVFIIVFMFIVSAFTPKPSAEQIAAITFTKDYKKQIRDSWNKWDVIATLGVVALCALFYAYFW